MNRFSITLAAALLASSAPAMAADPMEVRGVWLKGYAMLDGTPPALKQHDCFNAEKTYCQDTTAWEMPNKTYTVFLAIVLNGETIRKLCRAPADFNSRECVNDKDGQVEHQIWDTSAAAWRNQ
jgi:hypothetical protein